ncbi:SDR family oxidoreductase [Saccharomonospora azurea]
MTPTAATLVVGATGIAGSRTAAQLIAAGHRVKAASRHATPVSGTELARFDWYDPASHTAALDGVDRVYLAPAQRESKTAPPTPSSASPDAHRTASAKSPFSDRLDEIADRMDQAVCAPNVPHD